MATQVDMMKHSRGLRANLPILSDGQIAIVEDEGRIVIGTVNSNIDVPNQSDLLAITTSVNGAIDTANTAISNIAQALTTANLAKDTADGTMTTADSAVTTANLAMTTADNAVVVADNALTTATNAQSQVANIVTSNGTGKDSELVDTRTDSSGFVWVSVGEHVRNLDRTNSILKAIQIFTATVDNTSVIPIASSILSQIDITKIAIDVYDLGSLIKLGDNYTIDADANTIVLNGWSLATGETIEYRVYK